MHNFWCYQVSCIILKIWLEFKIKLSKAINQIGIFSIVINDVK